MKKLKVEKKLFVGTVNGESSLSSKKAKTYIHAIDFKKAVMGLFKRYLRKFGRAIVTDLFEVDKQTKKLSRVNFNFEQIIRSKQ